MKLRDPAQKKTRKKQEESDGAVCRWESTSSAHTLCTVGDVPAEVIRLSSSLCEMSLQTVQQSSVVRGIQWVSRREGARERETGTISA